MMNQIGKDARILRIANRLARKMDVESAVYKQILNVQRIFFFRT